MAIPNKIYYEDKVEYIRKDVLLKWVNKQLEDNVGQYSKDYDIILCTLIDKINEL